MRTTTYYRVIPSQEARAYALDAEESCHADPMEARRRALDLARDAAHNYRRAHAQSTGPGGAAWVRKGDVCLGRLQRTEPTHAHYVRWRTGTPELESRTLTLEAGAVVRRQKLTEPLTWRTGDDLSPEGTPQSVRIIVPLEARPLYVPLVHRAEVDDDGRVIREWAEPELEPADDGPEVRSGWRCQDQWEAFVECRTETIYWAVEHPPRWSPGLRWWTCIPMHGVPPMLRDDAGEAHWPSYPTRRSAVRAAYAHLRKVVQRLVDEKQQWRRTGALRVLRPSCKITAQERFDDVLWTAMKYARTTFEGRLEHDVQATIYWLRAEVIVPSEVYARVDAEGRVLERSIIEGPAPSMDDDVTWQPDGLTGLRVHVREEST